MIPDRSWLTSTSKYILVIAYKPFRRHWHPRLSKSGSTDRPNITQKRPIVDLNLPSCNNFTSLPWKSTCFKGKSLNYWLFISP